MSTDIWAKREVELAKNEALKSGADNCSAHYICECLNSALKAFNSLREDGRDTQVHQQDRQEPRRDMLREPVHQGNGQIGQGHTQGRAQQLHGRTADDAVVQGGALRGGRPVLPVEQTLLEVRTREG